MSRSHDEVKQFMTSRSSTNVLDIYAQNFVIATPSLANARQGKRRRLRSDHNKCAAIQSPSNTITHVEAKDENKQSETSITPAPEMVALNQISETIKRLEEEVLCAVCKEVPPIAISLNCPSQHVACLDCFVRLRFRAYLICQGNFNLRVELKNKQKESCPLCTVNVDFKYVLPNKQYRVLMDLYTNLVLEHHKLIETYRFCDCKNVHSNPMEQLKCKQCIVQCPFADDCSFQTHLLDLHEANALTKHLSECKGFSQCFNCHEQVMNCELQQHLNEHKKWIDFISEIEDVKELMRSNSFAMRMQSAGGDKMEDVLRFWKLFKLKLFKECAADTSPSIEHLLRTVEIEASGTLLKKKNLVDSVYKLIDTKSLLEELRTSSTEQEITEKIEDFLSLTNVVYEQPETCLENWVSQKSVVREEEVVFHNHVSIASEEDEEEFEEELTHLIDQEQEISSRISSVRRS
jgi:hypothetical protein